MKNSGNSDVNAVLAEDVQNAGLRPEDIRETLAEAGLYNFDVLIELCRDIWGDDVAEEYRRSLVED